jgi:RNA 3'-phosphate cyclase
MGVGFIEVDGSRGEGGGQILRTAVAFSAILRKAVRVSNIRAGRPEPGLKRQHVAALRVISDTFGGELAGAHDGSSEVTFVPGSPRPQPLSVDMGTAASITLVLQAVIPAVALNGASMKLDLVGGTDVPWSPTYDYFDRVVREAFGTLGMSFGLKAVRRGYYPRGGGRASVDIRPCALLGAIDLGERVSVPGATILSRCGSLPRHVAERQMESASKILESAGVPLLAGQVVEERSDSPGSSILVYHTGHGVYIGADGLGERGKPAEDVGAEAAVRFVAAAKAGAALDSNLADMLLPLLSLAAKPSIARIPEVTEHLRSGLELATQFTGCNWTQESVGGAAVVRVEPPRVR